MIHPLRTLVDLLTWKRLSLVGNIYFLKASYILLVAVPIWASLEARVAQTPFDKFILDLPLTLRLGYLSALLLSIAHMIYQGFCPPVIKRFESPNDLYRAMLEIKALQQQHLPGDTDFQFSIAHCRQRFAENNIGSWGARLTCGVLYAGGLTIVLGVMWHHFLIVFDIPFLEISSWLLRTISNGIPFDGYDFLMVSAVTTTGAGLLFGKAYLTPPFPKETATTFSGFNPFQLRNTITTRHEAVAGAVWLFVALVTTLMGIVRTVRAEQSGYLISSWLWILALLAAGSVAWWLTIQLTKRTSRHKYLPLLCGLMRPAFERHAYVVSHHGRTQDQVAAGVNLSPDEAARRVAEAQDGLVRIGKLLDEARQSDQDYGSFTARLAKYFPGIRIP